MRLNVLEYLRQATGLGNNATDMLSVLVWRKANSVQGPAAWASDAVEVRQLEEPTGIQKYNRLLACHSRYDEWERAQHTQ